MSVTPGVQAAGGHVSVQASTLAGGARGRAVDAHAYSTGPVPEGLAARAGRTRPVPPLLAGRTAARLHGGQVVPGCGLDDPDAGGERLVGLLPGVGHVLVAEVERELGRGGLVRQCA